MKPARLHDQGFTLIELMFAVAVGALMMAALVAAAVCLHRSFTAVDNYFASHVQQVRIMDYPQPGCEAFIHRHHQHRSANRDLYHSELPG